MTNTNTDKTIIANTLLLLNKYSNLKDVTIKEILYNSKISRSTFYRHFSSIKEVIFKEQYNLMDSYINQIDNYNNTVYDTLYRLVDYLYLNKYFYMLLNKHHLNIVLIEGLFYFENTNKAIQIKLNLDDSTLLFIIYGIYGIFNEIINDNFSKPKHMVIKEINHIISYFQR